jgi:oligopeptide transport system substrate-binding protein
MQLLYFFILLILSACSSEDSLNNVESGLRDQILYVNNGTEPAELDPHITTGLPEAYIQASLFEGLVSKDPQTLDALPGIAESWEISDDLTRFVFHIRENALWTNGDPITAKDVIYSWRRVLSPGLASEYSYMLYVIKNAEAYNRGEIKSFNEVGVKAIDSFTIEVNLTNPTPWFLQLLAHHTFDLVNQNNIEAHGEIDDRGTGWTRPENIVTNGPFRLKEWSPNKVVIVEKNPDYWDTDAVRLNEVHYYPIENKQTEERMFRTGQIHMTLDGQILTDKIEVYERDEPDLIHISPYLGVYYYMFNTTEPPFDDIRVRHAFSLAVDRQSITDNVVKGGRLPALSYTPPNTAGYYPEDYLGYDPEKARKLLTEAGYPGGEGFPNIILLYNTHNNHRKVATALQQMWKSVLNVDVQLTNQEWKVYLYSRSNLDYGVARAAWVADYADPTNFLDMFMVGSGNNDTGWNNAEYDRLIKAGNSVADQKERFRLFQQAEALLMQELPILPLYHEASIKLKHPSVKGIYSNVLTYYPFKHVYLSND